MKLSYILSLAPLAGLAAALPQTKTQTLAERPGHRANVTLGHLPPRKSSKSVNARSEAPETYAAFGGVDFINGYDTNYAISGEVIVPNLQWRADGPETQVFTVWIGIGGTNCNTGQNLAQTGIIGQVYSDGSTSWYAFYKWADQEAAIPIDNFNVNSGDTMTFQIILNSATTATANVVNKSSGQQVSENFSGNEICASDAFWLIEDLGNTNNFANYALAEFSDFYMTNALVIADNQYFNAGNGSIWTMARNGQTYVTADDNTSNIIFEYVGPQ